MKHHTEVFRHRIEILVVFVWTNRDPRDEQRSRSLAAVRYRYLGDDDSYELFFTATRVARTLDTSFHSQREFKILSDRKVARQGRVARK